MLSSGIEEQDQAREPEGPEMDAAGNFGAVIMRTINTAYI